MPSKHYSTQLCRDRYCLNYALRGRHGFCRTHYNHELARRKGQTPVVRPSLRWRRRFQARTASIPSRLERPPQVPYVPAHLTPRLCENPGCPNEYTRHTRCKLCDPCYEYRFKYGLDRPAYLCQGIRGLCTMPGCDAFFYALDRCRRHYHNYKNAQQRARAGPCAEPGCSNKAHDSPWCARHWRPSPRPRQRPCLVCGAPPHARSLCAVHYRQDYQARTRATLAAVV